MRTNQWLACGAAFAVLLGRWAAQADPLDHWTRRTSGVGVETANVTYAAGQFWAVGAQGSVLNSPDGIAWAHSFGAGSTSFLYGIAYGNSLLVAVGDSGQLQTSRNGTNWTVRSSATYNYLSANCYGNGRFVAVGEFGTVVYSTNGLSWRAGASGTSNALWNVASGPGRFVAVGHLGQILTSTNGVDWSPSTSGTTNELFGVGYGAGLFVVAGNYGTMLTSPDGLNWAAPNSGTADDLYGVGFGHGTFVVVGDSGAILTSTDALNWTPRNSGTTYELFGVAYGNGQFVAVGGTGMIVQSDPVIGPRLALDLSSASSAQLSVQGWPGQQYLVETSFDCTNWVAFTNLMLTNATAQCSDSFDATALAHFYRTVSP